MPGIMMMMPGTVSAMRGSCRRPCTTRRAGRRQRAEEGGGSLGHAEILQRQAKVVAEQREDADGEHGAGELL